MNTRKIKAAFVASGMSQEKIDEFTKTFDSPEKLNIKSVIKFITSVDGDEFDFDTCLGMVKAAFSQEKEQAPITVIAKIEKEKYVPSMSFDEVIRLFADGDQSADVVNRISVLTLGFKVIVVDASRKVSVEDTISIYNHFVRGKAVPETYKGMPLVSIDLLTNDSFIVTPDGVDVTLGEFSGASIDDIRFFHYAVAEKPVILEADIDLETLQGKGFPFKKLWASYSVLRQGDEKWDAADRAMRGSVSKKGKPTEAKIVSPSQMNPDLMDKRVLREFIVKNFSEEELLIIVDDVGSKFGVSHSSVGGLGRGYEYYTQNVVTMFQQHGYYNLLVNEIKRLRPMFFSQQETTTTININTGGGAFIGAGGKVEVWEFIGRDKRG